MIIDISIAVDNEIVVNINNFDKYYFDKKIEIVIGIEITIVVVDNYRLNTDRIN